MLPGLGELTNSTSQKTPSLARRTCLRFRCSLPPSTTWQSRSWIGTRRRPIRIWDSWREVYLTTSGPVALRYPTVVSKLNPPANDSAQLTVTAQVKNGTDQPVKGKLKGRIENIDFDQDVELGPNEAKDVTFTSG